MATAWDRWSDEAFEATTRARRIVEFLRTMVVVVGGLNAAGVGVVVAVALYSDDTAFLVTGLLYALAIALTTAVLLGLLAAAASGLELLATQTEHQLVEAE